VRSAARPGSGWWAGAEAALLATVALGAARFLVGVSTPPELLADAVIALFPPAVFSATLDVLGVIAKPLLTFALLAGQTALGALVGAAATGLLSLIDEPVDFSRASGLAALLGLVGWLAALFVLLPVGGEGFFGLNSPPGPILTMFSYLGVAAVYAASLAWFLAHPERVPRPANRRGVVLALGAGVAGSVLAGFGLRSFGSLAGAARAARLPSPITPIPGFYVVYKNLFPVDVDLTRWSLTVEGSERTNHFNLADLRAMPVTNVVSTLTCISNPIGGDLIGTARWTGVRLGDLLQLVGLSSSTTNVIFRAWDDYADSIPIDRALHPTTLLAYEMDGEPLRPEHGAPLRLLVPGLYGIKNVKWITNISQTDHGFVGYWPARGWTDTANVQTQSQIDVPADRSVHPLGPIATAGIAFAGDRGISRVEVSVDGGKTWRAAQLTRPLTSLTWTVWSFSWRPSAPGQYRLFVRAVDGSGAAQIAIPADPIPDGATGYDSITVRVV